MQVPAVAKHMWLYVAAASVKGWANSSVHEE
jgi:hypothetical protein